VQEHSFYGLYLGAGILFRQYTVHNCERKLPYRICGLRVVVERREASSQATTIANTIRVTQTFVISDTVLNKRVERPPMIEPQVVGTARNEFSADDTP
jgi:hypothetical protein